MKAIKLWIMVAGLLALACKREVEPPYHIQVGDKSATINGIVVNTSRHPALLPEKFYIRMMRPDLYKILLSSRPGPISVEAVEDNTIADLEAAQLDLIYSHQAEYSLLVSGKRIGHFRVMNREEKNEITIEGENLKQLNCTDNDLVYVHIPYRKKVKDILPALKSAQGCKILIRWGMD